MLTIALQQDDDVHPDNRHASFTTITSEWIGSLGLKWRSTKPSHSDNVSLRRAIDYAKPPFGCGESLVASRTDTPLSGRGRER